ncbi:hypothetical protein [Leptospira paudalimensis]|uniref:Uncharacterized protein n=1 Tax=Leptospira paudalimensis TaxID=2950024 RepID=A0ABT3M595_9LEPT|nr:hypothetical protein [Leptospira paudalimensis]MCW7503562.1 hypothetical protein [Leptospira paudalimensis]
MENNLDEELKSLIKSISDLPKKFDENIINAIKNSINSELSYSDKKKIAQGVIEISYKIYQTKRYISKPLKDIFYIEFQKLKTVDVSNDEILRSYFESIVIILLNLVPKKVDSGLYKLIKETDHKNNKIIIIKSVWKSFNENARGSLSDQLDLGYNIYSFRQ